MTRPARRASIVAAALVFVLTAAGCESGDDTTVATTTTSSDRPAPDTVVVQVFFVDQDAFNEGRPPYAVPVERSVPATAPEQGALDALFAGPNDSERAAGLRLVTSEASGAEVRVENDTAHVTLLGGCSSGGSTLTVANEILPTLLQFAGVRAVKIYDPEGSTEAPDEPGDSVPECLEP